MTINPYPIQIKKSILASIITWIIIILVVILIARIFSTTAMFYAFIITATLFLFSIIYLTLYLNSIEYSLDNKSITFKGGIISRFEKIIPYSRIQHVIIYEDFIQRILGLASVSVETAREASVHSSTIFNRGKNIAVQTGPLIPSLLKDDAEKLKNSIIAIANKSKPVAGI